MQDANQSNSFNRLFCLAVVAYSVLSLVFNLWVYAAAQFQRLTFEPMIVAGLFIGHIILLYFVKMDLRQNLFEWRGLVEVERPIVVLCRWLLVISVLAFAAQLGWLGIRSQTPAWDADREYKNSLIFQTVASLQVVLSLLFLFLALFGSRAFTSKRFRRLGSSPIVETGRWARRSSIRKGRRGEMR